ncbi:MAG: Rieske 2Fe-2S domain-containing protein [Gemmatimonadota bacterium]|nr:MAG: Rieske 2Fe-2S domain-containing protein [Gemmatimonadota bacterium]
MTDKVGRSGQSRRGFVNWILSTGVGGLLLAVLYPVGRYLVPPAAGESTASTVTLNLKPEDVAPNTGQIFKFGSQPAILVRTPGGELRAFSASCTHLSCIVQYREDIGHIWCACHNGHFDLNGRNIQGPPPRALDEFAVNVRGDEIVVSRVS